MVKVGHAVESVSCWESWHGEWIAWSIACKLAMENDKPWIIVRQFSRRQRDVQKTQVTYTMAVTELVTRGEAVLMLRDGLQDSCVSSKVFKNEGEVSHTLACLPSLLCLTSSEAPFYSPIAIHSYMSSLKESFYR